MEHDLLGQSCALMCAVSWAFALVLFKQSTKRIPPLALNLFKNVVGLVLLAGTLAVLHPQGRDGFDIVCRHPLQNLGILVLSGIVGIALADTVFFHALKLIGVGLISIVDCAYAPFAVLFSWLLLGEKLSVVLCVGGAMIIAGVFVASRHDPPPDRTRRQIVAGMLLAPLAVALMAFGIVFATPVLREFPVIWATTIRLLGGTLVLAVAAVLDGARRSHWAVFRPSRSWVFALPAAALGSYVSLLFWIAGFKYTEASIAAILNQTSVVFASVLAVLVLKESFGGRKIAALILAVGGVLIVTAGSWFPAWIVFVLTVLPAAFFWWRDRRSVVAGHCQHCGYSLIGNVSGPCPECGELV